MKTVLRVANVAVRAALLVIVAYVSFTRPWPGAWQFGVVVAAATAATVQLVLWAPADLPARGRLRYAFLLPYALAAVTITCNMAAATSMGGEFEIQAVLATLMAASDTSLAAGLNETRRAVHALRGETRPLTDGLAELSREHQRRHGARVTFEVSGEPRPLPPDAGLALTRTAQEALVNTAKHAPHQPVDIRLEYADAHTSLAVTNQLGKEADGDHGPELVTVDGGYGLAGMRERILLADGTLTAGRNGSDWTVVARIPR
jgi:signal transduction histidine kinase